MNPNETTVRIRLVCVEPLDYEGYDARYGIPDSKYRKIYEGKKLSDGNLRFDLELRARRNQGDNTPNFLGAWVVGTPTVRALYLQWQPGDPNDDAWNCRMKVHLSQITWEQIREMGRVNDGAIQGEVPGKGSNGGPGSGPYKPDWKVVETADFEPITESA